MKATTWLAARRFVDPLLVLLAAPVLVPVAVVALLAVVVEDRKVPIVKLHRVGRHGNELVVTKIRSMSIGEGAAITGSGDTRITNVGRVLRRWRVDEIPQVVQVLRGEMALIGPRPESPEFVDLDNPQWQTVLTARPAIAGFTQIIASPWEDSQLAVADPTQKYANVAVPAKLSLDEYYVRHASPLLDAKVIASLIEMFLGGSSWTNIHELANVEVAGAKPLLEPFRS